MNKFPIVSICVVTYNQENYIADCIESLLKQICDFDYEIIIGDDASTDKTREIIKYYKIKYPTKIKLILHENNVGVIENMISTYACAKGKYICHLDGDDMAYPDKIMKQVNALRNNKNCTICTHNVNIVDKKNNIIKKSFKNHNKQINNMIDLYSDLPFFAHSSKMFIKDIYNSLWDDLPKDTLDIEIHLKQIKLGDIFHINETLGSYRYMTGLSLKDNKINPVVVAGTLRIFEKALSDKDIDINIINKCYSVAMLKYAYQSAVFGKKSDFINYINKSYQMYKLSKTQYILFKFRKYSFIIWICKLRASLRGYKFN